MIIWSILLVVYRKNGKKLVKAKITNLIKTIMEQYINTHSQCYNKNLKLHFSYDQTQSSSVKLNLKFMKFLNNLTMLLLWWRQRSQFISKTMNGHFTFWRTVWWCTQPSWYFLALAKSTEEFMEIVSSAMFSSSSKFQSCINEF